MSSIASLLHDWQHGGDLLLHFLAGLELDDCTRGNGDVFAWVLGIAANLGFGDFDFKGPEVPHHNSVSFGKIAGDFVERLLDDVKNLLLGETGQVADTID